jgi:hypothetical protein
MKFLILAILYLFFPFRPMRQDNPPRDQRRTPSARPSHFQFATADLPYRPLRLTRQQVTMPDSAGSAAPRHWGKRLVLLAVVIGFGAVWLHGGVARQVISWARQVAAEDAGNRVALETGK